MAAKKPEKQTHTLGIVLIRERGQLLGHAKAVDAETAIKVAIEQFQNTNPEQQRRLIAKRVD
jgi:hypothetical protein